MESSQQLSGFYATPSPSGQFIASIAASKLRVCATHAPERFTELPIKIQPKDVAGLRWNVDSDRVVISSQRLIEVIDLQDDNHRIRLDNGSGGLGKFSAADFVGVDQLLVVWEFGKAKVWNLSSGRSTDLADAKTTCSGERWQLRPCEKDATATQTLALLSRQGVEDTLQLYLPSLQKTIAVTKLPTTDAQSLSWSPDGKWLAVLDTPTASTSVHFFTPDGHLFRSYPSAQGTASSGLGIKAVSWAGNSQTIGLARFDGKVALLNCRTFTPLAIIEHHTVIDQTPSNPEHQAPIWQEVVSASGERPYASVSQPFSPPLSRTKPSSDPGELGVAEASFSADGAFLATRDERMLNTVWIWDTASLASHAVIVQHSNVRRTHWHPSRPDSLLLDCGEAAAYFFNANTPHEPPTARPISMPGTPSLSWLYTTANALPALLSATKSSFQLLFPDGQPEPESPQPKPNAGDATTISEPAEGDPDDSLLDMLAGRTPLPPQSYTERIDMEVETEEGGGEGDDTISGAGMEDTFRGKRVFGRHGQGGGGSRRAETGGGGSERDPFDDSQIF